MRRAVVCNDAHALSGTSFSVLYKLTAAVTLNLSFFEFYHANLGVVKLGKIRHACHHNGFH